jgi:general secretion pathway protein H
MCSASAPTVSKAARTRTRTSAPGNSPPVIAAARPAARGFTLIELLIVLALIAVSSGLVALALRDPAASQLDHEAARLASLLESARAESRASGVAVRFELTSVEGSPPFRFAGLPPEAKLPDRWLDDAVTAEVPGARALVLGPEPLIGAQRIVLRLGGRSVVLATDGLSPFAPEAQP